MTDWAESRVKKLEFRTTCRVRLLGESIILRQCVEWIFFSFCEIGISGHQDEGGRSAGSSLWGWQIIVLCLQDGGVTERQEVELLRWSVNSPASVLQGG